MQQGGEPFLLPFLCRLAHTRQTLGHAAPVLCRWRVALAGVLLGSRPSLHHLRRGLRLFVRRLHRYYGAIRLLSGVHVRRAALGLPGPVPIAGNTEEVSRFSCMQFLSVPGVYDYAGPPAGSRYRRRVCGLPPLVTGSASRFRFSQLDTLPTDTSVYASTAASRLPPQDSRPGGSLLLSCKTLSFSTACRFIPAHYLTPFPRDILIWIRCCSSSCVYSRLAYCTPLEASPLSR